MQWKITGLAALAVGVSLAAVDWKMQSVLSQGRFEEAVQNSARETTSLRRAARAKLEALRSDLVREVSAREALGHGYLAAGSPFELVALAKPVGDSAASSSAGPGGGPAAWQTAWQEAAPGIKTDRWTNGFDTTLLAGLPYARARGGKMIWARAADAKGDAAFALLFEVDLGAAQGSSSAATAVSGQPVGQETVASGSLGAGAALPESSDYGTVAAPKKAIVAAVFSGNPLASLVEEPEGDLGQSPSQSQDGQLSLSSGDASFVVDDRGFAAAHSNKKYLGASLAGDSLVDEIAKKQRPSGMGTFDDIDGRKVSGRYEAIPGTNLYAVSVSRMAAMAGAARAEAQPLFVFGAAIALAALALVSLASSRLGAKDEANGASAFGPAPLARPGPIPEPPRDLKLPPLTPTSPSIAAAARNRKETASDLSLAHGFAGLAEGINEALRAPLAAIIGNAQLARRKSTDPEAREHADAIERDARAAKDALERFARFSDPEPPRLAPVSAADALDAACSSLKREIEDASIQIERVYDAAVPPVMADPGMLQAAFARAIENSVIAMRARGQRVLRLATRFDGKSVAVSIADTGAGMDRDVAARAFEPFFKAFDGSGRLGLGLSFARTAFELFSAKTTLASAPGEGTELVVEFPVSVSSQSASLINMKPRDIEAAFAFGQGRAAVDLDVAPPPIAAPRFENEVLQPLEPGLEPGLEPAIPRVPPPGAVPSPAAFADRMEATMVLAEVLADDAQSENVELNALTSPLSSPLPPGPRPDSADDPKNTSAGAMLPKLDLETRAPFEASDPSDEKEDFVIQVRRPKRRDAREH